MFEMDGRQLMMPYVRRSAVIVGPAAPLHAAGGIQRNRGRVRSAVLLLVMLAGLSCVDGVPKVKQQLNVHGHKDDAARSPNAASSEQVEKLYQVVLGRPVDEHGAAHYQSGKGYGMVQVADELLNSMEFRSKYSDNELVTSSIPVEYVQAAILSDVLPDEVRVTELDLQYLYSRLFDRDPDETALAAYKPIIDEQSLARENLAALPYTSEPLSILTNSRVRAFCFAADGLIGASDRYDKRHDAI